MSGILDRIDDTLDDWTGSLDSMRWYPAATLASERLRLVRAMGEVQQAFSRSLAQLTARPDRPSVTGAGGQGR